MKIIEMTKVLKKERDATPEEIEELAYLGSEKAKKYILSGELKKATTTEERLTAIEKYLGVSID